MAANINQADRVWFNSVNEQPITFDEQSTIWFAFFDHVIVILFRQWGAGL